MLAGVLLVGGMVSGCGKGKQEAAVSLDEARLTISSARKAGADVRAPKPLGDAESELTKAEQAFEAKNYGSTKVAALRAADAARSAEAQAKKKPAAAAAKPPRKAARQK
jgi:hypothetical protein